MSDGNPCVDIQIDSSLLNPSLNPGIVFHGRFRVVEVLESMCKTCTCVKEIHSQKLVNDTRIDK